MAAKFKVGDKVRLTNRIPPHVILDRGKKRTIVKVTYDHFNKCSWYIVGSNAMGGCAGECAKDGYAAFPLRSYQLKPWNTTGVSGRPPGSRTTLTSPKGGKTP